MKTGYHQLGLLFRIIKVLEDIETNEAIPGAQEGPDLSLLRFSLSWLLLVVTAEEKRLR